MQMPLDPDDDLDPLAAGGRSVRAGYESHGVAEYYRSFGETYRNPHEPIICLSLLRATRDWALDLAHVLDLAAGSGEVTLALRALGAGRIDAIDPYTAHAYRARTGMEAEQWTFEQIAGGALSGRAYSLIVCSFALHLLDESRLPGVAWALSLLSPTLLVLTPHKRPVFRDCWGWTLGGEIIVERVRTRRYLSEHVQPAGGSG